MWKSLGTPESEQKRTDYEAYRFSKKESVLYLTEGILLLGVIAFFFYRSIWAAAVLSPGLAIFFQRKRKQLAEKRREKLKEQFKDAIVAVSASQKAGYAIENAFREAYRDMTALYGAESLICRELRCITKGLENNIPLEKLLYDLGTRSHIPEIMQFAEVFMIAKRSGGNMTKILSWTVDIMEEKIAVDKEIQVILSSRKMEQKIMNMVPFFIIFYIDLTSKGFFDVLYHNLIGILIMTGCLLVYMAAVVLSEKLVTITI